MAFPWVLLAQAVLSKSNNEGAQKLSSAFNLLQGFNKKNTKNRADNNAANT